MTKLIAFHVGHDNLIVEVRKTPFWRRVSYLFGKPIFVTFDPKEIPPLQDFLDTANMYFENKGINKNDDMV